MYFKVSIFIILKFHKSLKIKNENPKSLSKRHGIYSSHKTSRINKQMGKIEYC